MKQVAIILLFASVSPIVFWLSGYDFNERGHMAVGCAMFTAFMAWVGFLASMDFK